VGLNSLQNLNLTNGYPNKNNNNKNKNNKVKSKPLELRSRVKSMTFDVIEPKYYVVFDDAHHQCLGNFFLKISALAFFRSSSKRRNLWPSTYRPRVSYN
jgi:hypothetical protein